MTYEPQKGAERKTESVLDTIRLNMYTFEHMESTREAAQDMKQRGSQGVMDRDIVPERRIQGG